MANSLFQALNGMNPQPNDGITQLMNQVNQFRQMFKGNPKAEVQKLLNSGAMTQEQFNKYSQMANQIMGMMK